MLLAQTLLDQVFGVEKLMTPRSDLIQVEYQTSPDPAQMAPYDIIPMTRKGRIVAIWIRQTGGIEPLTDRWLISRDTPIPDLIELFVMSGQPGLLVLQRQEIVGLVTPADLNKLPARAYIYNLVGALELNLASRIRQRFNGDDQAALALLTDERRQKISADEKKLQSGNVDVVPLQLLYLADLINIVQRDENIRVELGYTSSTQAGKALNPLVSLRDKTMHVVRPLLTAIPDDLHTLHKELRLIQKILQPSGNPETQ